MNAHNEQHDPASAVVKQNLTTQPAAAQEAVGEMVRRASGITVPQMYGSPLPAGTKLYAAPVIAAPADTWFADQLAAMGEVIPLDSTPAAPGIDLYPIRYALQYAVAAARENTHTELAKDFDELIRKIDASPKTSAAPRIDRDAVERLRNLAAYVGTAGYPSMGGDIKALLDALDASPKGGSDLIACVDRIEEAIEHRVPHDIYGTVHVELAEIRRLAQAGDAEVQP